VLLDGHGFVRAVVEQKAATPEQLELKLANSGMYCFRGDLLWKHIDEIRPTPPANEYYLTDMAEILTFAGYKVATLEMRDTQELLGINTRVELANVDRIFRERKVNQLMLDGVTIECPETVVIDTQVRIGMDTTIEPFARILGKSVIGADCHIGAHAIINESHLADRVAIAPLTIVNLSRVEADCQVGPFARLRIHNRVEAGAHIGNFVELKNTHFGRGSKASHLAYLGDSEIANNVNVGAGTITCNYDGVSKHRTNIGANAFIGSNSTLVAPIEIAEDSYIGAGSVITDPVPAEALALGRARQVIKPGWVANRKKRA
jgi:bifunctional UDP-N-acetylglucosamine pyrophosphorylase/glucosamine-1-phosphate N-acetyltransferase